LFQSAPLAVALVLLAGATARAQAPGREQRQRTVTVTGNPAEPQHEVRVSSDTPTALVFGADIRKKSLRVDATRIRVLDTGARSIIVQAVKPLENGERQELEVEFADEKAPARAFFVLVGHASEIDAFVTVARQEPSSPACPAEVHAGIKGPEDLLLSGYMDGGGVPTSPIDEVTDKANGLETRKGVAYRGKGWLMFQVRIRNTRGPQPWVPTEATLTSKTGAKVRGRVVRENVGEPAPGEKVRVLVVTEEPPPSAGLSFILELSGADGRSMTIPIPKVPAPPAPAEESKR
jgi:uncharacterized protein (TIGR02268 family)